MDDELYLAVQSRDRTTNWKQYTQRSRQGRSERSGWTDAGINRTARGYLLNGIKAIVGKEEGG